MTAPAVELEFIGQPGVVYVKLAMHERKQLRGKAESSVVATKRQRAKPVELRELAWA